MPARLSLSIIIIKCAYSAEYLSAWIVISLPYKVEVVNKTLKYKLSESLTRIITHSVTFNMCMKIKNAASESQHSCYQNCFMNWTELSCLPLYTAQWKNMPIYRTCMHRSLPFYSFQWHCPSFSAPGLQPNQRFHTTGWLQVRRLIGEVFRLTFLLCRTRRTD